MVEEASATKAKTQLFIEKVEQHYSIGVVTATLALFFVPLALGAALQPTLLRAMTFMIVASPVRGRARHDAAAAVRDRQRRPPRRAGQVRGRDGTARLTDTASPSTRPAPSPRAPRGSPTSSPLPGSGLDRRRTARPRRRRRTTQRTPPRRAPSSPRPASAGSRLRDAEDFASAPGRGVTRHRRRPRRAGRLARRCSTPNCRSRTAAGAGASSATAEQAGRTAVVVLVDGLPAGVLALADQLRPTPPRAVARADRRSPAHARCC